MRYNVAQQLVLLAEALGPETAQRELLAAFTALLKDSEAEVRVAAASRVATFSRLVPTDQVSSPKACGCAQMQGLSAPVGLRSTSCRLQSGRC